MQSTTSGPLRRAGFSLVSAASLTAIGAVVLLVSLSRLRGFVVRENEQDALGAVRLLAERLPAEARPDAPLPTIEHLVQQAALARRLPDALFLEDGRLMECHGYLFEVVRIDPAALGALASTASVVHAAEPGACAVRAWPCVPGETGTSALLATASGRVLGHPNTDRRWGGTSAPPTLPGGSGAQSGWRTVP